MKKESTDIHSSQTAKQVVHCYKGHPVVRKVTIWSMYGLMVKEDLFLQVTGITGKYHRRYKITMHWVQSAIYHQRVVTQPKETRKTYLIPFLNRMGTTITMMIMIMHATVSPTMRPVLTG